MWPLSKANVKHAFRTEWESNTLKSEENSWHFTNTIFKYICAVCATTIDAIW